MKKELSKTAGTKYDKGKAAYHLIPANALHSMALVARHGADKYEERDWEKGMAWGRIFRAAMSHLWAFWRGECEDPDSGLPHLAHAAFCCMQLLEFALAGVGKDDRSKLHPQHPEDFPITL